jgi:hypothetical protein
MIMEGLQVAVDYIIRITLALAVTFNQESLPTILKNLRPAAKPHNTSTYL